MNSRTLIGLALITLALVLAAAASVGARYGGGPELVVEEMLFPELVDRVNDVARIDVTAPKGNFTLVRRGEGWVVEEKDGYPIIMEKVRISTLQLSQLRLMEAKTSRPGLFPRLEVEDPDSGEEPKSKRLRLEDDSGAVLAEVIVGKRYFGRGGRTRDGVYVRLPDEQQAWLVRGKLEFGEKELDWIDPDIMDVAKERVMSVVTKTADGTRLAVSRPDESEDDFEIESPPAENELGEKWRETVNRMAASLAGLKLDDVRAASAMDFTGEDVVEAEVRTFDGLLVRVTLVTEGEEIWARFEATTVPAVVAPKDKEEGEEEPETAKKADQEDEPRSVEEEAADINARLAGWVYNIPDFDGKALRTQPGDLLAEKEEESPS